MATKVKSILEVLDILKQNLPKLEKLAMAEEESGIMEEDMEEELPPLEGEEELGMEGEELPLPEEEIPMEGEEELPPPPPLKKKKMLK